jgi:hypothetical protein
MFIGASMAEDVLASYKLQLQGNHMMRIFPTRKLVLGGSECKLPPAWDDPRVTYCQTVTNGPYGHVVPFVSSKGNGTDQYVAWMRDYLVNMPAWVKMLYFCDWHEPEADYGAGSATGIAKYKTEQTKIWNMVQGLPTAIRAKVRFGHVMTKQWAEGGSAKGNDDYSKYDTGLGDFFGIDSYVLSNTAGDVVKPSTLPAPVPWLAVIKAYAPAGDSRPRIFPELGLIGMPDDLDGTVRANWLQGVHDELKTWKVGAPGWTKAWSFEGWIWWHTSGKATGEVPRIGQARDFPLHLRSVPDPSKTYTTTDPATGKVTTHWISNPEQLPNQAGKTQPAPLVTWNAIWAAENSPPPVDPGPTDPGTAPPIDPYPSTGIGSYLIGATMKKEDIPAYESRLAANRLFRIFPNSNGVPPSWDDPRWAYAQRTGATVIVSSNCDGDATKYPLVLAWLTQMPSWVTKLYITDRHEPHDNFPGAPQTYLANFRAWWEQVILKLPASGVNSIRSRVKAGPILTMQWIEDASKGNGDYSGWDPMKDGIKTDFYGVDAYMNSWKPGAPTQVADAYPNPVTFLSKFKAYKYNASDDRERLIPEFGAIGIPNDPDGSKRAAFITGVFRELDTWTVAAQGWKFAGISWWNNQGTTSSTALTPIGTLRFMYLDKYQVDTSSAPKALPGVVPAPLAAYNQAALVHPGTESGAPNPNPGPPVPDPGGGGTAPVDPGEIATGELPIDTPAASRLLAAEYILLITDRNLNVIGDPVWEWSYLQVTLRWKEPGSGQFKVPAYRYLRSQLAPGNRVVVLRRVLGVTSILISGPIEQKLREKSDDGENGGVGQYTVTFAEDMAWLAYRLSYPDPTKTPETQTTDFWSFNGNPEQAMLELVDKQAGAGARAERRVPGLRVAPFSGISGTGTIALGPTTDVAPRERLETVTEVLRKICMVGYGMPTRFDPDSLGFRTRQTKDAAGNNIILFEPLRSRDLRGQVHFSFGMGNLKYYSFQEDAPEVTHLIVGGQYNENDASAGADKYIAEFASPNANSKSWGRYEAYLARPGLDVSQGLVSADVAAEFREKDATARLAVSAADTVDCRAGVHYGVGDIVSVELDIGEWVVAPVQTISIQAYPTSGEVVGTTIGDQSAKTDTAWIRRMRALESRMGVIERRGAAQPATTP